MRFSYNPQHNDELELNLDDEIDVLEDAEDGWARGQIIHSRLPSSRGKIGIF